MSEKRGRAYSKKHRSWRRGEDSSRDKEASSGGLKPTAILSKPKATSEEYNPDFPTLLQANAAGVKKPASGPSPGPPVPTAPNEPAASGKERAPAPPEKKRDPLDSLEFFPVPDGSLRLVDAKVGFHESGGLQPYLSDTNTDFLVVGVIGSKGSGKSSLLNGLIGSNIFKESDAQSEIRGEDTTQGIDAWISAQRVIFLDAQPTLNGSFIKDRLSHHSSGGKIFSLLNCYLKKDSLGEKESLLLTLFLMNVCHCLLFVQDYVLDPEVLHFLQLAEMLKPSSMTSNKVEYYPNLVLVHNKLRTGEMCPSFFRSLAEFYDSVFAQSAFQVHAGISAGSHSTFRTHDEAPEEEREDYSEEELAYAEFSMPPDLLKARRERPPVPPGINLFALNDRNSNKELFKDLMDYFSRILLSTKPSRPLTTKTLTEKSWFTFAAQAWQNTCLSITSFNYEFNIAAAGGSSGGGGGGGGSTGEDEFRVFKVKS